MIILVLLGAILIICGVILYVIKSANDAKKQKYYNAAYKMIKETCLNQAIKNHLTREMSGQMIMVYLEWKEGDSYGYVFNPVYGIRIGRDPEKNEICIRENIISSSHCKIYLTEGGLAIQDYGSINGTYLKRHFWTHKISGSEYLYSGDKIRVGNTKITVKVFTFDMSNI